MRIAGIDPGSQRCGYAVIESLGGRLSIVDFGVWKLMSPVDGAKPVLGTRLERLHTEAKDFFNRWNPSVIGFEKAVAFKNVSSALVLSEARGVLRLAAFECLADAEQRLCELSPTAVKKHSAGLGLSQKTSVLKILSLRFNGLDRLLDGKNFSIDAVDALAIAWTAWILSKRQASLGAFEGVL